MRGWKAAPPVQGGTFLAWGECSGIMPETFLRPGWGGWGFGGNPAEWGGFTQSAGV